VKRDLQKDASIWTKHLVTLAIAVFAVNVGQGFLRGANTNFFVDTLGLSGGQVLWLAGIREIPGLALMFIAALIMRWPCSRRAAVSILLMAVGYGLYSVVHSFSALIAISLIASLGFHNWMPLQSTLSLSLTTKENSGKVLGSLSAVSALASITGMGLIMLSSRFFESLSLRAFYVFGGVAMAVGALVIATLPKGLGGAHSSQPRILLHRRYWLYYVLIFFEGSRMQVFGAFGTLILVQNYGLQVWEISLLLLVSGVVNFLIVPLLGRLLDRFGERIMLSTSYVALALCFMGYATFHNAWLLGSLLVCINLLVTLRMGLSTYVNRIAPAGELTPTLSAGVSVNHVTSVSMSVLAGTLLSIVGYEALCWGAAAVIMVSVPFALALKVKPVVEARVAHVSAE
jgi:predicted MFS family arabinose efflux permease